MSDDKYLPIIGLEIHVELKTNSKMFCGCKNDPFAAEKPNIYTCPVCLGLPGALPVPNRRAIEWCVILGLALNCKIPEFSKFDRKNYFYPDLPKGYQISQYDQPFCVNGYLDIHNVRTNLSIRESASPDSSPRHYVGTQNDKSGKRIGITRVHMEEDTGKLLHSTVNGKKMTLIDFNRSGVPLVEIVTEPDIRSSEEAKVFLKKLHQVIRYLGISDADMEKGSMRLEPNVSVRRIQNSEFRIQNDRKFSTPMHRTVHGRSNNKYSSSEVEKLPNYKVEVKNINSFGFAKKAIDYEIERHIELLEKGEAPKQETRGWDEKKGITVSQRSKEEAQDYRYFPEPDIPPVRWTKDQIRQLADQIPELPDRKLTRFIKDYELSEYDATILTEERETAEYFEKAFRHLGGGEIIITPKMIANWIINRKIDIKKVTPEELLKMIHSKTQVAQIDKKELEEIINQVLNNNEKAVTDYKSGKTGVLMFLVGQVMRELKGKGNATQVRKFLEEKLV